LVAGGSIDLLNNDFNPNQVEKSPEIEYSTSEIQESPSKAQPDQTDAAGQNKVYQKEFITEVVEEGAHLRNNIHETIYSEEIKEIRPATPRDHVEMTHELYSLHAKVDDLLRKSHVSSPALHASYSARSFDEGFYTTNYGYKPQEHAKSSYGAFNLDSYSFKPHEKEKESRKSSYSTRSYIDEKPLSSSAYSFFKTQLANEYKPKYDAEKLDRIVNRILGNPLTYETIQKYGNKSTNLNDIVLSRNSIKENPVNSRVRKEETIEKPYYCGDIQNDKDSVMGDYIHQAVNTYESNKQKLTNFYVGSLIDDIDEVPRTKKIGRRQQIAASKKLKPEEAKKFFVEDEKEIEDFDFDQHTV